ncbi:MAG TPA: molecular chaperone HtpG [Candidatus Edwardsbacteria bacterium]|nr:molecular chaperone HtpG [Candidatus Edwardsbacteria bacterium]
MTTATETRKFTAEVDQVLRLVTHSLYSHKEIFLRELVSNASDALDKLKFLTLTDEKYKALPFDPRIDIEFDAKDHKTLVVRDCGIGMNAADLEDNLGTIAKSGTRSFVESLKDKKDLDLNLIGQFGVGFYSAFMVADRIEVISRKAGESGAFKWESDGQGEYEISAAARETQGTTVILHLNDEGREFAARWQIEDVVKKYSNHVPFPIYLHYEEVEQLDGKKETKTAKTSQINAASALWRQPKRTLKDEDYAEFYKTLSHDSDDPLLWIHTQAEGKLEYSTLFYVPQKAPFDMFRMDYRAGVKLYVKRVFITDDEKELMPTYLRFLRGVIDSEDLPLNVSREMLQHNMVLVKIKQSSVKKVLSELEDLKTKDRKKYEQFYKEYHVPLKEGLYQDFPNREALQELVLYKSTKADGLTSLFEYVQRMKPDQKSVYYITGKSEEALRNSPLLEMYRDKEIEVLLMDDEIDEIAVTAITKYKDFELKSLNRSDAADDLKTKEEREKEKESRPVVEKIKAALGDAVKDVRASVRLSDSPSCVVADENDPTIGLQHIMKMLGQKGLEGFKPILEVNPDHAVVKRLAATGDQELVADISHLLLEQAMLIEGVELKDPAGFVKRLNRILGKAV